MPVIGDFGSDDCSGGQSRRLFDLLGLSACVPHLEMLKLLSSELDLWETEGHHRTAQDCEGIHGNRL